MKRPLLALSYCLLGLLSLLSVWFAWWAGHSPSHVFRFIDILPWLIWLPSPYVALAILLYTTRDSRKAVPAVVCGAVIIGSVSTYLMFEAYSRNDKSGMIWLAVPFYELIGCLLVFIITVLIRYASGRRDTSRRSG